MEEQENLAQTEQFKIAVLLSKSLMHSINKILERQLSSVNFFELKFNTCENHLDHLKLSLLN